ncbi:hypothetical protein FOCC_FOCC014412 [Frankliniella occidentalis]|nr:hypothetical protein FOCC_FOCC014412 [Frankliniella occidentalis]
MQRVYRYLSLRPHHFQPRRNSAFSGVYVTAEPSLGLPSLPRHHTVELDVGAAAAAGATPCSGGAEAPSADPGAAPGGTAEVHRGGDRSLKRGPRGRAGLALLCCRAAPLRPSPRRSAPDGADAAGAPGGAAE